MTEFNPGLVSTIIAVHNRPQLLQQAVASVLAQTYQKFEIIICDDGSNDGTGEICDTLAATHAPRINVIHQRNAGPAAARQAGLERCGGEFVQYLDSDDLLLADKFARQVAGLNDNPQCAVSYGMTRRYHIEQNAVDEPDKGTGQRIDTLFPSMLESRWWSTSTPLYRREICERAGPWNAELRNEEDWEYDCRIAALGVRLHFVPEFVSETRDHDGEQLHAQAYSEQEKLRFRAKAHGLILQHAQRAGITASQPQMQHFARALFLLCRQCGALGLHEQSRQLFELAIKASTPQRARGWDFRIYQFAAHVLGWRICGRLGATIDFARALGTYSGNPASGR